MSANIIVIGAKSSSDNSSRIDKWNNDLQAAHFDLVELPWNVICMDPMYPYDATLENIRYVSEAYVPGMVDNVLKKDAVNIIIEFCNLFDENWINHDGYIRKRHKDMMIYNDHKVVLLSCGCSWNQGFPRRCIEYILDHGLVTKFNAYSVDDLLYTMSAIQGITMKTTMYPYIYGLYQMMGTFMWRGCEKDSYESEGVLRELFGLLEIDNDELRDFINGKKHWNQMLWKTRKEMSAIVYGDF